MKSPLVRKYRQEGLTEGKRVEREVEKSNIHVLNWPCAGRVAKSDILNNELNRKFRLSVYRSPRAMPRSLVTNHIVFTLNSMP